MKPRDFLHKIKLCHDCPHWPAGTQQGYPTPDKIAACLKAIKAKGRSWMTADEFLAQVEAHRQERLRNSLKARKPFVFGTPRRTYVLDWSRTYVPPRPKLIIPENLS